MGIELFDAQVEHLLRSKDCDSGAVFPMLFIIEDYLVLGLKIRCSNNITLEHVGRGNEN